MLDASGAARMRVEEEDEVREKAFDASDTSTTLGIATQMKEAGIMTRMEWESVVQKIMSEDTGAGAPLSDSSLLVRRDIMSRKEWAAMAVQLRDEGVMTREEWEEEMKRIDAESSPSSTLLAASRGISGGGSGVGDEKQPGHPKGGGEGGGGEGENLSSSLSAMLKSFKESVIIKAESDGVALQLAKDTLDPRHLVVGVAGRDLAASLDNIASRRSSAWKSVSPKKNSPSASPSRRKLQRASSPFAKGRQPEAAANDGAANAGENGDGMKIQPFPENQTNFSSRCDSPQHSLVPAQAMRALSPTLAGRIEMPRQGSVSVSSSFRNIVSPAMSVLSGATGTSRKSNVKKPAKCPPAPPKKHTPVRRHHRREEHTSQHFHNGHLTEPHEHEGWGAHRWEMAGGKLGCFEGSTRVVINNKGKRVTVNAMTGHVFGRPTMGYPLFNPEGTVNMRNPSAQYRIGGRMGIYTEVEYGRPSMAWMTTESCPSDWPSQYMNMHRKTKREDKADE